MKRKLLPVLLCLAILCSASCLAISISPANRRLINYEPGKKEIIGYNIAGAPNMSAGASLATYPEMQNYIRVIDPAPNSGPRSFQVEVEFPEKMQTLIPGDHYIMVSATEVSPPGAGIVARASINVRIQLIFPYPGKYMIFYFEAPSVNQNETVHFKVNTENKGTDAINLLYADIDVLDFEDKKITTLHTDKVSLNPREAVELSADFSTRNMMPGSYKAIANIYYDDNSTIIEKNFSIGTLQVDIVNHTTQIYTEKINPFEVEIESGWNNRIENVYAEITLNNTKFKTPSQDLDPWKRVKLSTYIAAVGYSPGQYNASIAVFFNERMIVKNVMVDVVKEARKESPLKLSNMTIFLILAMLVLLGLNILLFLTLRKKKEKKEKK